MSGDLYLPDTPEGRAIEQIAVQLSDKTEPGQLAMARKLSRIAALAMCRLVGADDASLFFVKISRDCLQQRGVGKGAKRA